MKELIKLKYDLIGAYQAGHEDHPQRVVQRLGMECKSYEGHPMGDFVVIGVDQVKKELPDFIKIYNPKKMTHERQEKITNSDQEKKGDPGKQEGFKG